jgi:hydrogenase expression/formation protein HypE
MKVGKVPPEVLRQYVFNNLGIRRDDVLVHSALGEDCSVIDFGEYVCVLTTDPITGAVQDIGRLAVNISCNDIAACGAEPVGLLVAILAPESTTPDDLGRIMGQINAEAAKMGIEVLGGHSEITAGIDRVIVITTAVGRAAKDEFITTGGARPGDALLLTKGAGYEGTAVLAAEFAAELEEHLGKDMVARARSFLEHVSVLPEGRIAARSGATAMHDVTEGGILGAAAEMAAAAGAGVELWAEAIPVAPETTAICAYFNLDPYALVSSGAMLIAAPEGDRVLAALQAAGIPAAVIGRVTPAGTTLVRGGKSEAFAPPERDELWKVFHCNDDRRSGDESN